MSPIYLPHTLVSKFFSLRSTVTNKARQLFKETLRSVLNGFYGYQKVEEEEKLFILSEKNGINVILPWEEYINREYRIYRTAFIRDNIRLDEDELKKRAQEISGVEVAKQLAELEKIIEEGRLGKEDKEYVREQIKEIREQLKPLQAQIKARERLIKRYEKERNEIYERIKPRDVKTSTTKKFMTQSGEYTAVINKINEIKRENSRIELLP